MNDVEVFLEKLYEESLSKRQDSDFLDVSSELIRNRTYDAISKAFLEDIPAELSTVFT